MEHISQSGEGWLILEKHPDFSGQWVVNSLKQGFLIDFIDLIGPYRAVGSGSLAAFLERAKDCEYQVAIAEDSTSILEEYNELNSLPEISLNSQLKGTENGLLPYQVQGFNFLKNKEAGVAMWSTGTGKTVLANALLKFHLELGDFDYAFFVVRAHNKFNTQRALSGLSNIDSVVLDGPQKRRQEIIVGLVEEPTVPKVVITNYEKFRIDQQLLLPLFENRVLLIWDEMPTKLKNRKTALYKSVRKLLYTKVNLSDKRPKSLRQYMLSATPIENGPEDWFNCIRLLDPSTYGSITQFHNEFVATYSFNQPVEWIDLDRMGLKSSNLVHRVDKESPDISKQFPKILETSLYIDWHEDDRIIYDKFIREIKDYDPLALIQIAQFLCNAPSMVSRSAALRQEYLNAKFYKYPIPQNWGSAMAYKFQSLLPYTLTDTTHTKLETLRQLVTEDHKNEKIIIFSAYNEALMPILEQHLQKWLVNYVRYNGTIEEKQTAQDYFQKEDFVQVFLTSDQGSDSISLEEASVVIHYDLPWKWSTYIQRQNRAHRITSAHNQVRFYTLLMANSIEERKLEVISRKQGFHNSIFDGNLSTTFKWSKEDLLYILGS